MSESQIIGYKTENCNAGKNIRKVLVNIYEWGFKKVNKVDVNTNFPCKKWKTTYKKLLTGIFSLHGKKTRWLFSQYVTLHFPRLFIGESGRVWGLQSFNHRDTFKQLS